MAVKAPETDSNIQQTGSFTSTETQRAPGFTSEASIGTTALFRTLHTLGSGQALGQDVEKYIESIRACFPRDPANSPIGTITVRRLSEPHGAHAFQAGDAVFILMFDSLLPRDTQNFIPSSDYGRIAYNAFQRDFPKGTRLLHVVLVQPEDYARPQQMADYIMLNLAVATGIADGNIGLLAGNQFTVDPSVETARNFIEQYNPHAMQPRIDIGFTIFAKTPRTPGSRALTIEESQPIAAVGAYVEVWLPEDRQYTAGPIKYAATVHITSITSRLPLPGIVPMCMAIAADQFIEQGRWLAPFMTFAKGKPNLGNLSMDPQDQKKMWFASSPDELYKWREANMYPRPFLALDVSEGQARIPAMAVYGDPEYMKSAYNQITAFFGNLPFDGNVAPFTIMAQSFNGQYGDPRAVGKLTDSRDVDYLKLLAEGAQDPSARLLLQYNVDPAVRARVIYERTGGTFKSLYRTRVSIIDPRLLSMLASEIVKKVAIDGPQQTNRIVSTPWLADTMHLYSNTSFNTSAPFAQSPGYAFGGGMHYGV